MTGTSDLIDTAATSVDKPPTGSSGAASYILFSATPIVQVLSPQVKQDVVVATVQTIPSGIIAATIVSQADFDNQVAGPALTGFANSIEAVIAGGKAVGGTGTTSLDDNGLQQYFVTFEVVYNPPGAPTGTVTADVDVPISLLGGTTGTSFQPHTSSAGEMIDAAYANLVALSQG